MIKISEPNLHWENGNKIIDVTKLSIKTIAHEHFNNLKLIIIPKLKFLRKYAIALRYGMDRARIYSESHVIPDTKNALLKIFLKGDIKMNTHYTLAINDFFSKYNNLDEFIKFCDWLIVHLRWIILSPPTILEKLKSNNIATNFPSWQFGNVFSELTKKSKKHFQKYILSYSILTSKKGYNNWNNASITQELSVKTCYYCNRQSVIAIVEEDKDSNDGVKQKIITPQLDHFFDKSKNPLLALSFYNLIPCCSNCNLKKGASDYRLDQNIHPYLEEFGDDAFFHAKPKHLAAYCGESEDFEISIHNNEHTTKGKKIKGNLDDLWLEDIYNQAHKDIVREIAKRRYVSNDRYLQILVDTFSEAKLSLKEAYQLGFGNYLYEEDFHKRPLAKFTRDIARDFDLI
jgi:5-methylcytosine-specific restriction endonuclease McrA